MSTLHYTFAHTIHLIYLLIEHCHFVRVSPALGCTACPCFIWGILSYTTPVIKALQPPSCQAPAHISLFLGQALSLPCMSSLPCSLIPHLRYTLISKQNLFVSEPSCSKPEHVTNTHSLCVTGMLKLQRQFAYSDSGLWKTQILFPAGKWTHRNLKSCS